MSRALDNLWAKSQRGQVPPESLLEHTIKVLRTLRQIQERWPSLHVLCGEPRLWHRVFWSCCMHDFGKAADGFQYMVKGHKGRWGHRHEVLSLAFLDCIVTPDSSDYGWIAATVCSHHRDASEILDQKYDVTLSLDDTGLDVLAYGVSDTTYRELAEWMTQDAPGFASALGVEGVFALEGPAHAVPTQESAAASTVSALKAYDALRRRLARQRADSPSNRQAIVLRGVMTLADHLASADAPNLRHVDLPDLNELFSRAKLDIKGAASHQSAAGAHVGNMILTAPTGSGKTEAALVWAARQRMQALWPANVVYVLPYQASLNAMSRRLKRSLNTEVGLLHGRSAQVLYRELVAEATPDQAERRARRAADLARLRQPCVTASTPYQLLRGAYRLRGYESQWMSLSGALLIVDEIHAYETKRLGLLLGLLAALITHWDTRVASITATLPTWLRQLLRETIEPQEIEASSEVYEQFQRHSVSLINATLDSPQVLDLICNDVRDGLSVLVVVNTIKDAQAMWTTLSSRLPEHNVLILHSRFTSDDRLRCEAQIMTRLNGMRNGDQPVVLVSTQAVEVSLDLDFDTLYTQPAPLEALAQRFGRVNRRGSKGIVPVHVLTEPQDGQGIYDPRLVERALAVLTQHDGEPIDEGRLTTWLDDVYDGGLGDEYMSKVRASKNEFERVCLNELRAFESDDAIEDAFEALFDGTEVLPASLEVEFNDRMEQSVLFAHGLLVPMSYTALYRYRAKIRIRPVDRIKVIDLPYDQNMGLQLTR